MRIIVLNFVKMHPLVLECDEKQERDWDDDSQDEDEA